LFLCEPVLSQSGVRHNAQENALRPNALIGSFNGSDGKLRAAAVTEGGQLSASVRRCQEIPSVEAKLVSLALVEELRVVDAMDRFGFLAADRAVVGRRFPCPADPGET
jgi:hypothetical protein